MSAGTTCPPKPFLGEGGLGIKELENSNSNFNSDSLLALQLYHYVIEGSFMPSDWPCPYISIEIFSFNHSLEPAPSPLVRGRLRFDHLWFYKILELLFLGLDSGKIASHLRCGLKPGILLNSLLKRWEGSFRTFLVVT